MAVDSASLLRVLIATDNHLGVHEEDPIRRDDAFVAFEEILAHAVRLKVDALLLGGDIFHENKPSRRVLRCCLCAAPRGGAAAVRPEKESTLCH